jgi:hypothetical protein
MLFSPEHILFHAISIIVDRAFREHSLEMMAGSVEPQAIFTHGMTTGNDGCFWLPAAVRSFP